MTSLLYIFVLELLICAPAYGQMLGAGLVPPAQQKTLLSYSGSIHPNTKFGDEQTHAGVEKGTLTAIVPFAKRIKIVGLFPQWRIGWM